LPEGRRAKLESGKGAMGLPVGFSQASLIKFRDWCPEAGRR